MLLADSVCHADTSITDAQERGLRENCYSQVKSDHAFNEGVYEHRRMRLKDSPNYKLSEPLTFEDYEKDRSYAYWPSNLIGINYNGEAHIVTLIRITGSFREGVDTGWAKASNTPEYRYYECHFRLAGREVGERSPFMIIKYTAREVEIIASYIDESDMNAVRRSKDWNVVDPYTWSECPSCLDDIRFNPREDIETELCGRISNCKSAVEEAMSIYQKQPKRDFSYIVN
jgi:hypothetical protein